MKFIQLQTTDILDVDVLISETLWYQMKTWNPHMDSALKMSNPNQIGEVIANHDFVTTSYTAARKVNPKLSSAWYLRQ